MQSRHRQPLSFVGGLAVCVAVAGCADACQDAPVSAVPSASASTGLGALDAELRARVLAKVGGKTITLGEYAATLERMNEFERLRYQSPDRRRLLLDEMIEVELLAGEARRRGLDALPETRARVRQILRDELLREARRELPKPEELPASEVRAYYEAHRAEFQEPERRRVAHLEVADKTLAAELLEKAQHAPPKEWGRLVRENSLDRKAALALGDPVEFAGDLGIVAKPGVVGGENPRVPEPLRAAVFRIERIGGVLPELVEAGGTFHIVRMLGKTDARQRGLSEAESAIRVRLLEKRARELEQRLERQLRERFAVSVDQKALDKLKLPDNPKQAP